MNLHEKWYQNKLLKLDIKTLGILLTNPKNDCMRNHF